MPGMKQEMMAATMPMPATASATFSRMRAIQAVLSALYVLFRRSRKNVDPSLQRVPVGLELPDLL